MALLPLYIALFLLGLAVLGLLLGLYFRRTEPAADGPIDGQTALNAIGEPVAVVDASDIVVTANVAFRSTFDADPAGKPLDSVLRGAANVSDLATSSGDEVLTIPTGETDREFRIRTAEVGSGRRDDTLRVLHFSDVTGLQERVERLELENERLEEFATFLTHDLRNPLDVAIGRTNAIAETVDDPTLRSHLGDAAEAHRQIRRLISDVSIYFREACTTESLESVDLAEHARDAWRTVETGDASLSVADSLAIEADPGRLRRIFENLFRNAVEHGGDDVTVTVGALPDGGGFFVADDGSGIPESDRESVREAGYSTLDGGTGLGIPIVSRIAEAHGWQLSIGESADGGARFAFSGVRVADEIAGTTPESAGEDVVEDSA